MNAKTMALKHLVAVVLAMVAYYVWVTYNVKELKLTIKDLPEPLQEWRKMGDSVTLNGREMFYIYKKCNNLKIKDPPTFALVHGYPSSSYDYHKVLEALLSYGNVVLNDHIGFGFSETPTEEYTYSINEAADNILALWRHLGLKNAHIISHDMGDSVLTEILARRFRKMLPSYFDNFFSSVTFTNGGMNFKMINFRIGQIILMYPKIAKPLISIGKVLGVLKPVFQKQIAGLWSTHTDPAERDQDIEHLYLLNLYNGAHYNMYNTNYYLWDRHYFEFRWFQALRKLDLPCRFIWGDSDAVSPIAIPKSFENIVPNFDLTLVEGKGHFWMLEDPSRWVEEVVKILDNFSVNSL